MEGVPDGINTQKIIKDINNIDEVALIHDFHLWSVGHGKLALSAHVNSNEHKIVLEKITAVC